jgi:hypothetical protein
VTEVHTSCIKLGHTSYSPKEFMSHSLETTALCLFHHYKWIGMLLWNISQYRIAEQGKNTKSALSQNLSNRNKLLCRLPAPGIERTRPMSVGLDMLAMVVVDWDVGDGSSTAERQGPQFGANTHILFTLHTNIALHMTLFRYQSHMKQIQINRHKSKSRVKCMYFKYHT